MSADHVFDTKHESCVVLTRVCALKQEGLKAVGFMVWVAAAQHGSKFRIWSVAGHRGSSN